MEVALFGPAVGLQVNGKITGCVGSRRCERGGQNNYGRSVDPPSVFTFLMYFDFLVELMGLHRYISATGTLVVR